MLRPGSLYTQVKQSVFFKLQSFLQVAHYRHIERNTVAIIEKKKYLKNSDETCNTI